MRLPALALVLSLTAVAAAQAATVPYRTDAELIALATRVVRGRVIDNAVERTPDGAIRTRTRLAVLEDFTGGVDRVITVYELGGRLPDGTAMWIPGAPRFAPAEDVVLCLEAAGGGFRTVSMAFAAFRVRTAGASVMLERFGGVAVVGGPGVEPLRTLTAFRQTASAVKGVRSRVVMNDADAAAAIGAAGRQPVTAPFTLLGDGLRWRQVDSDVPLAWYRNTLTASPLQGGDTDNEIRVALDAWTRPTSARIVLTFSGTRTDNGPQTQAYCTGVNLGVGLITFGDPANAMPDGVLAIGGGCSNGSTHVVNGTVFEEFSHGLVILNDTAALAGYTTVPNFTRIVEHEIGHAIGLDHTDGDQSNIMYPSCCAPAAPVPPAIGADDLAGVTFIYPMPAGPSCTYTLAPNQTTFSNEGGDSSVTITPAPSTCTWTAASAVPWIYVLAGSEGGTGTGTVRFEVLPHLASSGRSGALRLGGQDVAITQLGIDTADPDGDGLLSGWESFFGLDPNSAAGDNGAGGDPDGDGLTNLAEQAGKTHPRGSVLRYLAEGDAGAFFDTQVALFNPGPGEVTAWLRIQPEGAPEQTLPLIVPARSRRTVSNAVFASLSPSSFSTLVEADGQIVVDRTMRWDGTGYGSHAESAVEGPSTTWYLAEGSTSGEFALFYLLQNPGDVAANVTVRFLRPRPLPPITRTYTVAPRARRTIPVDTAAPEIASTDVSGVITSDQPIVVERSMYLSRPGQPFAAGHESAGVTAPATQWFLAEGATGTFFDLFVLIANPGTASAQVEVDYLLPGGGTLTKAYAVSAESRFTIYVDDEQIPAGSGQRPLASTAVAMRVRSTNAVPIIVERAMWWPQPTWYEAHNAPGTTATGTRWALAEGYAGGPNAAETYVLIANTSPAAAAAIVTLFFEDGTSTSREVPLAGESRTNVAVGAMFPTALGRRFAVLVDSPPALPVPMVVERAMYESPGGVTWAAGTAAVATKLQ
jgi:matrixin